MPARRHLFHSVKLTDVSQLLRFAADVPLVPDIWESVQVLVIYGEQEQTMHMPVPQPLPTYVRQLCRRDRRLGAQAGRAALC